MSDRTYRIVTEIKNNEDFIKINSAFDSKYNTKTYYAELTLMEIWDNFMVKNHIDNIWCGDTHNMFVNFLIDKKVERIFKDKNITRIRLSDPDLDEDDVRKLYALYLLKMDLIGGGTIHDPICISAFPNGSHPIHPGTSRMLLAAEVNQRVPVILTNYNDTLNYDCADKLIPIEQMSFDFEDKGFIFVEDYTDDPNHPKGDAYFSAAKTPVENNISVNYKEIVNVSNDYQMYNHPKTHAKKDIEFVFKRKRLYIDGMVVAEFRDVGPYHRWFVTMQDQRLIEL